MLVYHQNFIAIQANYSTDNVSNRLRRYDEKVTELNRTRFGPPRVSTPGTDAYLGQIAWKRRFTTARLMEAE